MNRFLLFVFGGTAAVGIMMLMGGNSPAAFMWGIAALVALGIWINFIPTWVAYSREHPNRVPILLLNIFLGWTLIGWVGALVWACLAIPEPVSRPEQDMRYRREPVIG